MEGWGEEVEVMYPLLPFQVFLSGNHPTGGLVKYFLDFYEWGVSSLPDTQRLD